MQIFSVLTTACCNSKSILEPWFFDRKGGIVLRVKALLRQIWFWRVLSVLCAAGFAVFIFSNSWQTGEISGGRSSRALEICEQVFSWFGLRCPITEYGIRKTAHFLEFFALGILLSLCLRSFTASWPVRLFGPGFFGLAVPVADEFIQSFISGRGSLVSDVVLDFSGAASGILVTNLVLFCIARGRSRRRT